MPVKEAGVISIRDRLGAPREDYKLSVPGQSKINIYVNGILAQGQKGFIQPIEHAQLAAEKIDADQIIKNLPPGVSKDDLEGMILLSLRTECATASYTKVFMESARKYGQPWLGSYIQGFWDPDEKGHHLPFRTLLRHLGHSDASLDQHIKEAREKEYIHGAGRTPIHLSTFGTWQEDRTRGWYGLIGDLLHPSSPKSSKAVGRVQGREGFHTIQYRDITAMQIEDNPRLLPHVAEALVLAEMPGNQVAPELEAKVSEWINHQDVDIEKIKKSMVKLFYDAIGGNTQNAGKLVMEFAEQQGKTLGPFHIKHVVAAMNKFTFGEVGYGLVGEAMLEKIGMKNLYQQQDEKSIVGKVRGVLRTAVGDRLGDLDLGYGPISPSTSPA